MPLSGYKGFNISSETVHFLDNNKMSRKPNFGGLYNLKGLTTEGVKCGNTIHHYHHHHHPTLTPPPPILFKGWVIYFNSKITNEMRRCPPYGKAKWKSGGWGMSFVEFYMTYDCMGYKCWRLLNQTKGSTRTTCEVSYGIKPAFP